MKAHIRAICQKAQPALPYQNIISVTSTGACPACLAAPCLHGR